MILFLTLIQRLEGIIKYIKIIQSVAWRKVSHVEKTFGNKVTKGL